MKVALLLLAITASFAFAENPAKPTPTEPAAGKVLLLSITIPAARSKVWQAFATSDGLSTWLTPGAVVDLRPGGEWTAHFPGGSTGGGTILRFTPKKQVVMSAMAPDTFPHVRAERTTADWEFRADGAATTVKLTQTGWKEGAEWDKAYDYLAE